MRKSIEKYKFKLNGVQILTIGFFMVIFIGGLILSLPISSANGEGTNLLDSLFTSTSSVCVTGLITVDTGTHWSTFGQIIIMSLIEIGGLGFMSFATIIAMIVGKKITLRERLLLQESFNTFSIQGLVKWVRYVLLFTVAVQIIGAIVLAIEFIPKFGFEKGLFFSIFHSISAFCNAGFDLFGNYSSLTSYYDNSLIVLTIAALIIIGGLGFFVWNEILHYKKTRKLSVHSKIVLTITAILLIGGTIIFFMLEYNNANTLQPMSLKNKTLNAFFASVTPRTAGFNTIDLDGMTPASKFVTIILMFIGGSPGSTAGGLKTATFGILILTFISVIRGKEDVEAFGKRFTKELVYKAFTLAFIAISIVIVVTLILSITEKNEEFLNLLYESTSAFGTVGVTTGVTQRLSSVGKVIIMLTMYCGRVGPLTIAFAIARKRRKDNYKYPEGKILIG